MLDQENDELFIKIIDPDLLNIYIQRLPSNTEFQLAVIALDTSNSNQTVVLQYTDAYHQDPSSWKNLTISIIVYPTEPPKFTSKLNDVVVSACENFSITLPEVVDDDSESFWIELDPSTPSWITLIGNSTLTIDALDANLSKTQTVQLVTFKLSDDSGAVVHPQLKLLIDTSMLFMFNQFDDIKAVFLQKTRNIRWNWSWQRHQTRRLNYEPTSRVEQLQSSIFKDNNQHNWPRLDWNPLRSSNCRQWVRQDCIFSTI